MISLFGSGRDKHPRRTGIYAKAKFYGALGLSLKRHSHGNGPLHLTSENAGQVFEIYPLGEDGQTTSAARIGFSVPSVDEAYFALLSAGGIEVSAPKPSPWGRRAVISDPDGHHIELTAIMNLEPALTMTPTG